MASEVQHSYYTIWFHCHEHDKCIYSKYCDNGHIILYLYVNDILILKTSHDVIQRVKDYLSQNFNMKDLGPANMILGMKISRIPNEISLSLAHNIERIYNSKPISTLYDSSISLKKNMGEHVSQLKYSQLIC